MPIGRHTDPDQHRQRLCAGCGARVEPNRRQPVAGGVPAWAGATSSADADLCRSEGTPIPTSIVIVFVLGAALALNRIDDNLWLGAYRLGPALLHPLTLIYADRKAHRSRPASSSSLCWVRRSR